MKNNSSCIEYQQTMPTKRRHGLLFVAFTFFLVLPILTCRCTSGGGSYPHESLWGDTLTRHARLLTLVRIDSGIMIVDIVNPWDTTSYLGRYILVDKAVDFNERNLPEEYQLIRTPIASALVFSSVHTSAIEELSAGDIITGIADSQYFRSPFILSKLAEGSITDVGNPMSPSLERIIELSPEVILTSPYQNAGHGALDNSGISIIDMADYMENTPLGRAEWILLLGALSGQIEKARKIYNNVISQYNEIKQRDENTGNRPLVITEVPYNGTWFQPGGKSYITTLIHDAGGRTITDKDTSAGSVQLDITNVYEKGNVADVWIIKSYGPMTKKDLTSLTPLASNFKSFQTDNIWYVDTKLTNFYDEIAFHPERALKDYKNIISQNGKISENYYYFVRLED